MAPSWLHRTVGPCVPVRIQQGCKGLKLAQLLAQVSVSLYDDIIDYVTPYNMWPIATASRGTRGRLAQGDTAMLTPALPAQTEARTW
jgi:hypothetical protein